ncbi:MAG: UDP-3-O-(3-hydroxymyristoyl)glucosamine N-acyltransferase [Planctomycetota bacterium]|jgi:UDP-3-O-[3-hydroxymyristoyl] glucosamine N-acyltransferase
MPTLNEICKLVGGELKGPPDFEITGVGSLECAGPTEIAAIESWRYQRLAKPSKAGAFLVSRTLDQEFDRPYILSDHPLDGLNRFVESLGLAIPNPEPGVHETSIIHPSAEIGEEVHIGPHSVVGPEVRIGAGCVLHPGVVVERGVTMGEACVLEPGAVLHPGAELGDRVRIGAHAVVSRQGFGYAKGPKGPVLLHHVGKVVLEDDVHIGAGSTIDRARYDETRIGRFSALDNLVHIGHNCTIGQRTFVAAQTGLAGHASFGNDCEIGGQVGVGNGCGVGDRCRVAGKSGLTKLHGDDATLTWNPAADRRSVLKMLAKLMKGIR